MGWRNVLHVLPIHKDRQNSRYRHSRTACARAGTLQFTIFLVSLIQSQLPSNLLLKRMKGAAAVYRLGWNIFAGLNNSRRKPPPNERAWCTDSSAVALFLRLRSFNHQHNKGRIQTPDHMSGLPSTSRCSSLSTWSPRFRSRRSRDI